MIYNNLNQKNFLIVGPSWVGDMVMAQSLFKLLKFKYSDASIDVLAPIWTHPLLERMPEISASIILPICHGELGLKKLYKLGKSLREKQYDQAIVLPNSFKSALIPFFAKIPKRTGFLGEMRYGLLNDIYYHPKRYHLMVERFKALALNQDNTNDLLPKLNVTQKNIEFALQKHHFKKPEVPILAICPGAEFGPSKRWPDCYFSKIANDRLNLGWQVWLFGSPNDMEISKAIQEQTQNRCINLTGKTTLTEAVDLLSLADIVLTNDSGLMHIAAALDKPIVALFGSSSPKYTPPLHKQAQILSLNLKCSPCFKRECPFKHHQCMNELQPDIVLDAIQKSTKT